MLLSWIYKCIALGSQHSLPSTAQATVWSTFHQLRQDLQLKRCWGIFISTKVPVSHQEDSQLALRLLLDRLLKKVIQEKSQQMSLCVRSDSVRPLTTMESNAIRYMAGYVTVILLKSIENQQSTPNLKSKETSVCVCASTDESSKSAR